MEQTLNLREYQQGAYKTEKAELGEALSLIKRVLPLYEHAFLEKYWPYIAKNNASLKMYSPKKYSSSTNAMIMVMLLDIREKIGFSSDEMEIEKNIESAKKEYFDNVDKGNFKFESGSDSYGINDPLNLNWAYTLCKKYNKSELAESVASIIKNKLYNGDNPRELDCLLKFNEEQKFDQQEHSFIALYAYRCAVQVKCHKELTELYYNFFELRLHQHLSFKSIPDSRFDPSELVFCLEGMLLCKRSSVSDEILHRVFEVLGEAQDTTPCWRPVNPIYATPQGQIFLPLSIEVGMSLLNIFYKIDSFDSSKSYFAKYLPILRRYFRWLKAQKKTVQFKKGDNLCGVSGWESEHVGTDGVIHIWQTALILNYLASYAQLLKRHIAQQYLTSSGLCVEYNEVVEKCKNCFFESSNPFPAFMPVLDFKYNLPNYVLNHFISRRKPEGQVCSACPSRMKESMASDLSCSLLLFGPPGTGKSYFTKKIAMCLKWKHITVTPSDFLADGSAEIEARAKGIFSCLMEQENTVILFDEIDQFILDRDSKRYREQSDIFKLLTPGMLPKFQDLRDNAKCIFVIATNYADRIDPAIVRLGRVDVKIPLMPPSWEKRVQICVDTVKKMKKSGKLVEAKFEKYDFSRIADITPLFTWKELTNILESSLLICNDDSLELYIQGNGVPNLSFKKILNRIEPELVREDTFGSSRNDLEVHDSIIEELALMCMAYGKETDNGLNCFEEHFEGYGKIIQKVSNTIKSHEISRLKANKHD